MGSNAAKMSSYQNERRGPSFLDDEIRTSLEISRGNALLQHAAG
jgi:hypothetical protein